MRGGAPSSRATAVVRQLVDAADLPGSAGLRIAQRDDHTALAMSLQRGPGPHDVVVPGVEVAVFLGPVAARRLAGRVLDASSTPTRSAFYLRD